MTDGSATFITNQGDRDLSSRLSSLASCAEELRFLVGYFYFSGIRDLFDGLKSNKEVKIRILVGLEADELALKFSNGFESDYQSNSNRSLSAFVEQVISDLARGPFDTADFYEQAGFFLELLKAGRLEIRKSREPNHAKLYLFSLNESQIGTRELFITGSSNLTLPGLRGRDEFNVEISDFGYEEASTYFEKLWANSIRLTEFSGQKEFIFEQLTKNSQLRDLSPLEAYYAALRIYLEVVGGELNSDSVAPLFKRAGYRAYAYQLDAVSQGVRILEEFNGVIVADVVGLGKSVIASAIAARLGGRGVLIAPPGLLGSAAKGTGWAQYLEDFGLHTWQSFSSGKLEEALDFVDRSAEIETVIVDEAHRFRNQDTESYETLHKICRNRRVILLTATPFNNSPADIFSLLKLFTNTRDSDLSFEGNLEAEFDEMTLSFEKISFLRKNWVASDLEKTAKRDKFLVEEFGSDDITFDQVRARGAQLAKRLKEIIEPVVIRRNRIDLVRNPRFAVDADDLSSVADPIEGFYYLDDDQSAFYRDVVTRYFADPQDGGLFQGAMYRPHHFEAEQGLDEGAPTEHREFLSQQNLSNFMRRLLVKRFESSVGAFISTLRKFEKATDSAICFIEKSGKFVLDRELMNRSSDFDDDEIQEALESYATAQMGEVKSRKPRIYDVEKFVRAAEFRDALSADLELIREVLTRVMALWPAGVDPKMEAIIDQIRTEMSRSSSGDEPKRKVVVFSEYLDSVRHLYGQLPAEIQARTLMIDGEISKKQLVELDANFNATFETPVDDYDLIISGDKLSEGFNLNRAGTVINLDIPWNPVRVIQRVGRINRISKKVFDELFIVNFFPSTVGADIVKSREIAAGKMFLIHSALGEDSKIFDQDEEPSAAGLYERLSHNPDEDEKESFRTWVENEISRLEEETPELAENHGAFPARMKVAKTSTDQSLCVILRSASMHVLKSEKGPEGVEVVTPITFEDAVPILAASPATTAVEWNVPEFWEAYEAVMKQKPAGPKQFSAQSLENKAVMRLDELLQEIEPDDQVREQLQNLKAEIILGAGIPTFSLRRIIGAESIEKLIGETGVMDYVKSENQGHLESRKERTVILAVHNRGQAGV